MICHPITLFTVFNFRLSLIASSFYDHLPHFFAGHTSKSGSYTSSYTQQDLTDDYNAVFEEKSS